MGRGGTSRHDISVHLARRTVKQTSSNVRSKASIAVSKHSLLLFQGGFQRSF